MSTTIDPQTILTESKAYADSLKADLDAALDRLESYSTGFQTWVSFPTASYPSPEKVSHIASESMPTLAATVFGAEFTDPVEEIEKYKTHIFVAPMLDDMQETLWGWVDDGGVGISDSVQSALWNNMRERDLQTLQDTLDVVASTDSKRGFQFSTKRRPSTIHIESWKITRDNRNYEITAKIAELAQLNVQNAIQQNIAIEQLHSSFALGLSGIFLQLKNRIIDKYRLEMEARIAEYEAKVKAILAGYDLAKANANLDVSYQELLARTSRDNLAIQTERTRTLILEAEQGEERRLRAMAGYVEGLSKQLSAALLQTNGIAVTTSEA